MPGSWSPSITAWSAAEIWLNWETFIGSVASQVGGNHAGSARHRSDTEHEAPAQGEAERLRSIGLLFQAYP